MLPAASFFKKRFVSTRNAFTCHWLGAACTLAAVKRMHVNERKTHSLKPNRLSAAPANVSLTQSYEPTEPQRDKHMYIRIGLAESRNDYIMMSALVRIFEGMASAFMRR